MIDLIKKSLLAGVGAAVVTKEKIEEAFGEYVREGKVSAGDARIMAEKIAEQGRREFDEVCSKLGTRLRDAANAADGQTQARIAALEQRVLALEAKAAPPPTRSGEP